MHGGYGMSTDVNLHKHVCSMYATEVCPAQSDIQIIYETVLIGHEARFCYYIAYLSPAKFSG